MLDNLRVVTSPEGIELRLRLAGLLPRAVAWLIDLAIRIAAYGGLAALLSSLGQVSWGPVLIAGFVIDWLYPVLFECLGHGASPGKRILRLRVVHDDGTPVGWSASLVRNTLRFADLLPFVYAAGALCVLINRDFKRLGDLAAGTVVVHEPSRLDSAPLPAGPACPPPLPLAAAERRVVLEFALREKRWSRERAAEIAERVPSLLGPARGPAAVERLLGYARHFAGSR